MVMSTLLALMIIEAKSPNPGIGGRGFGVVVVGGSVVDHGGDGRGDDGGGNGRRDVVRGGDGRRVVGRGGGYVVVGRGGGYVVVVCGGGGYVGSYDGLLITMGISMQTAVFPPSLNFHVPVNSTPAGANDGTLMLTS